MHYFLNPRNPKFIVGDFFFYHKRGLAISTVYDTKIKLRRAEDDYLVTEICIRDNSDKMSFYILPSPK